MTVLQERRKKMQLDNIALFDMDDTIVDFDIGMLRELQKMAAPGEFCGHSHYSKDDPLHIRARKHSIMRQVGWWRNLPRKRIGFQIMEIASAMGFEIHILTKGPSTKPHVWTEKIEWCKEHLGDTPVTITQDKGLVYGKVLVDDYPAYIERWLKWRPRGLVVMPDTVHNRHFDHPNVVRATGENFDIVEAAMTLAAKRPPGERRIFK